MKLLYGVCGEGLGHAMRSAVVAQHLEGLGHTVQLACSPGRAHGYLAERFPGKVLPISGLSMVIHKNAVSPLATFAQNLLRQLGALPVGHLLAALRVSSPDVVLSDFEPLTARYAAVMRLPLVAVDNIHFMNRFVHNKDLVSGDRQAASLMHPVVSTMVPGAKSYLVTSIAGAAPLMPDTSLHLPILRPEILSREPSEGDDVLVYFNNQHDHRATCSELFAVPEQAFRVYGALSAEEPARTTKNVTLCPLSEEAFIDELCACKAVISGAGFTLMSEAIYLGKPLLAVPFEGQFEQILNANYLGALSYGMRSDRVTGSRVREFLGRLPDYRTGLARSPIARGRHDGNRALFGAVERAALS